ncbi:MULTISPECIES: AMP-binding protein [unclassified Sphingobacterium]|uniref:AMP-binding protein n=1 Tax=unclassified Sphingobacterium TaxID=2609468 RepID=UPI001043CD42|nr:MULTISPECIES: AMP-binding protein [unclassified Sphingobacterium]MCS3556586.1 acyl-CoA synthetase (AMP-forming)/AMP-acid ligase II [Sphingobacterium sp. JUb21]TCQ99880.1 AMP-binding enzyme [Sphingobacterium sp. JUb20]
MTLLATDSLYQHFSNNTGLRYLDNAGESYSLTDLAAPISLPKKRGLAFLYLDNSIDSISLLLRFIQEDWAIALLSPKLDLAFKERLESQYHPHLIYDPGRTRIKNHTKGLWRKRDGLFYAHEQQDCKLHPKLKLLLSTSGTTGSPKFVKLSEQNLIENALSILDYLPVQSSDVTPLNLPIFYSYGLSVFTSNSIGGGKIVCSNSDVMQKEFWSEWDKFQYTSLAGVPYLYELLDRLGFLKKEYPHLRYLTQAGGKLNNETLTLFAQYAKEKKHEFFVMYGQTEATARMSFLAPDQLIKKMGSIGKPIKNGIFHIDPETTELHYKGPNVFGGYAEGPADLIFFSPPTQLTTGDLAERDEDGFYYITGRSKRIVKLFGIRINLDEIEQLLKVHFPATDCVCIGIADKFMTICFTEASINQEEIKELLFKKVHILPQIIRFKQIQTILRTNNGKVDYHSITEIIH